MQPDERPRQNRTEHVLRKPRRLTDRVEDTVAWLLASMLLVALVAAMFVGARTHADVLVMARVQATERTQVPATLTRDTPRPQGDGTTNATARVPVRWTGKDGVERVDNAEVCAGMSQGDTIPVWVDRSNHVVPPPLGPTDAVLAGILAGGALLAVVVAVLALAWTGTRRWTMARNCARWAREWVRVEASWRRLYL